MIIAVIGLLALAGGYYAWRYYLLKSSITSAGKEAEEIATMVGENRIFTFTAPDKDLEKLLSQLNLLLDAVRKSDLTSRQREQELKRQMENMSHDLRTPLTSVLGYLKLIAPECLSEEDQKSLSIAIGKANSLQYLIQQFYELSRLESDEYQQKIEVLDLGRLIKEGVIGHYGLLSSSLQVKIELPDQPLWVLGDKTDTQRILTNLFDNTSKYAQTTLTIFLDVKAENYQIVFENDVAEYKESDPNVLFERFYTGDASRVQNATGLGLTVARQLARKMGGNLWAQVKPKDGVWLSFVLQMKEASTGRDI